jgi:hypothetical protein
MPRPPPHSFLLRVWRERTDAPLRATLITITQPTEQRHFATLDALHAFLLTQLDEARGLEDHWDCPDCTVSNVP